MSFFGGKQARCKHKMKKKGRDWRKSGILTCDKCGYKEQNYDSVAGMR